MSTTQLTQPLVAGERMTRDEFLRRWEATPNLKFAELIGGVVYMPVSFAHGKPDSKLAGWLAVYAAYTPGVEGTNNTTTLLLEDVAQPDSCLLIMPECGGQTGVERGLISGAPELTAEISVSSLPYDLNKKLDLYRRAGVLEYVILLPEKNEVRWLRLEGGQYRPLAPDADGILRSRVFPGLWLDAAALTGRNMARVLEVLQRGLASAEHAGFVRELTERKNG